MVQLGIAGGSRTCGKCGFKRWLDREGDVPELVCPKCEETERVRILTYR